MLSLTSSFAHSSKISAQLQDLQNDKPAVGEFTAKLVIDNPAEPVRIQRLEFDTPRLIYSVSLAGRTYACQVVGQEAITAGCYQTGNHVYLHFVKPVSLSSGETTIDLQGQYFLKHDTDGPEGLYVATDDDSIMNIPVKTRLPNIIDKAHLPLTAQQRYLQNQQRLADKAAVGYLIPKPVTAHWQKSLPEFTVTQAMAISTNSSKLMPAETLLRDYLRLNNDSRATKTTALRLTEQPFTKNTLKPFQQNAAYQLTITENRIVIRAYHPLGIFYGLQSLRELYLMSKATHAVASLPQGTVVDYPRFAYRGLLLDTARNFFTVPEIKQLLDLMAMNKLNYFHWHLTDDEAWRLADAKLPALTKVGAVRGDNMQGYAQQLSEAFGSGAALTQGEYYSANDVAKVLAYAKQRHITVVPEIDVPGHARALKIAYPQLFSPNDDAKYLSVQNFSDDVLDACYAPTYQMLSTILSDVAAKFPSEYIHLGGDEVATGAWHNGALIQQECMNYAGTADATNLAHFFMDNMAADLVRDGKKVAAWDEVGLANLPWKNISPSDVRLYLWHYDDLANEINKLAAQGYQLILTPANYLYFDLAYGSSPREPGYYWASDNSEHDSYTAYSYNPLAGVDPSAIVKIKGVQGALWSETLIDNSRMEYMAFPRVAALAELAWTPQNKRYWSSFAKRLGHYYLPIMDTFAVNYRLPLPGMMQHDGKIYMNLAFPGLSIHYTIDGSQPTANSPIYRQPWAAGSAKAVSCSLNRRCSHIAKLPL
jgi:hexosaminidase